MVLVQSYDIMPNAMTTANRPMHHDALRLYYSVGSSSQGRSSNLLHSNRRPTLASPRLHIQMFALIASHDSVGPSGWLPQDIILKGSIFCPLRIEASGNARAPCSATC